MQPSFWGDAARHVAVVLCCTALGGCGLHAVNREANRYRAEMDEAAVKQMAECRRTTRTDPHELDHRQAGASAPDCYTAVIFTSSRPLLEATVAPGPQQEKAASVPSAGKRKPVPRDILTPQELAQATSAADVLGQVAWPAMLSKVVYRRYLAEENRSSCADEPKQLHPLNRLKAVSATGAGNWETWGLSGVGCKSAGGLFYETFVYRPGAGSAGAGSITHAFIVFRGTENYKGQLKEDWGTNLAMALDLEPSQFKQVQADLKELITQLKKAAPGVRIYTAGHSLGGSLAQLAAYISKDVETAYAFNTSPVSGWTWLRAQQAVDPEAMERQDPAIIRVMQDDELAALLRLFSNAANSTVRRAGRTDVALDFPSSRDVLAQSEASGRLRDGGALHSITLLACNLAARVANGAPGAFGFTRDMATAAIQERDGKYAAADAQRTEGLCQVIENGADCEVAWTGNGTTSCKPAAANAPRQFMQ